MPRNDAWPLRSQKTPEKFLPPLGGFKKKFRGIDLVPVTPQKHASLGKNGQTGRPRLRAGPLANAELGRAQQGWARQGWTSRAEPGGGGGGEAGRLGCCHGFLCDDELFVTTPSQISFFVGGL